MDQGNLLTDIPECIADEIIQDIVNTKTCRIERVISNGHTTPKGQWYDQANNEWVLIVKGAGKLEFEVGEEVLLREGDHIVIPAHKKHRVSWTDPDKETVWLAVFF